MKNYLAAFVFCLIFYIVIPAALILAGDILLSAASVLDPLHSKDHLENIWSNFTLILIFQILFAFFAAFSVAFVSSVLAEKIRSGWLYPAAIGASFIIHYALLIFFTAAFFLASRNEITLTYAVIFGIFLLIFAPVLGIVCAGFAK